MPGFARIQFDSDFQQAVAERSFTSQHTRIGRFSAGRRVTQIQQRMDVCTGHVSNFPFSLRLRKTVYQIHRIFRKVIRQFIVLQSLTY